MPTQTTSRTELAFICYISVMVHAVTCVVACNKSLTLLPCAAPSTEPAWLQAMTSSMISANLSNPYGSARNPWDVTDRQVIVATAQGLTLQPYQVGRAEGSVQGLVFGGKGGLDSAPKECGRTGCPGH